MLLLAGGLAIRAHARPGQAAAVVAAHDLRPGVALGPADLAVRSLSPGDVPAGAVADPRQLLGRTVAGPVRSGEALTDVRIITPRLAGLATAIPDARAVSVRLPDQTLADMLRPGDVVDVVTVPQHQPGATEDAATKQTGIRPPEVLAQAAVVLLVSEPERSSAAQGRVALLAMDNTAAQKVAAVTLIQAVTVISR